LFKLRGRNRGSFVRDGCSEANLLSKDGGRKEDADPAGKRCVCKSIDGGADDEGLLGLREGENVIILV